MISLLLVACSAPSHVLEPITGVFVDPEGTEWVYTDADVKRVRFDGSSCQPATWYQVSGWDPAFFAWFGVPDSGDLHSSNIRVNWGSDEMLQTRFIRAAQGEVVTETADLFEYRLSAAQECTHPETPVDPSGYDCFDMAGTAIVRLEGDLGGPLDAEPVLEEGQPWATSPSGDAICGGEPPGT